MVYPEELKTDIVAQHKNGVSVKQLSTEYGIVCGRFIAGQISMAAIKLQKYQMTHSNYSAKEYHNHVRRITKLENINLGSKNRKLYSSCSIKREAA